MSSNGANDYMRKRIRERREELGFTQLDVAVRAGVNESSINMIERGVVKPKPQTVRMIAEAIGVGLESLYETGTNEIAVVSREMVDIILDSDGDTYEPRGLFICVDIVDDEKVYTAVRNLDGSGETEEFRNKRAAIRWLEGYKVHEKCFYRPREKDRDVEKVKRVAECM